MGNRPRLSVESAAWLKAARKGPDFHHSRSGGGSSWAGEVIEWVSATAGENLRIPREPQKLRAVLTSDGDYRGRGVLSQYTPVVVNPGQRFAGSCRTGP